MRPEPGFEIESVFATLRDILGGDHDVVDAMDELVEASTRFTAGKEAGVVLADAKGALHVIASSTERTADIEEAQLGIDEGPCLDCVRSGDPIDVPDLRTHLGAWPQFSQIARDRGFGGVHASPLTLRGHTFGTLCIFTEGTAGLSDQDIALVQSLADAATVSVVQQQVIQQQTEINEQLQFALDSRVLIEQAKGALSERRQVPIDEAFRLLRTYARSNNQRLREVADRVVHDGAALD